MDDGAHAVVHCPSDMRAAVMPLVHIGCCGFPVKRATYYTHLSVVEIQQTFYSPPKVETARRWRAEAPPGFGFAIKAWQLITHPASSPTYRRLRRPLPGPRDAYGFFRPTDEVWAAWEITQEIARALAAEWIIFQCPARFTPTDEHIANLRAFFARVERREWRLGWEPRGEWPPDLVRSLCQELDLVHVVDPFKSAPTTEHVAYFRLHGIGGYRYRFTDDDLRQLAGWCQPFDDVWVMFNNVSMWEDARRFAAWPMERHAERPEGSGH